MSVSVGSIIDRASATLEADDENRADYRLASPNENVAIRFPPEDQNIALAVILFSDDLPERTEAFTATYFPNFGPSSMGGVSASTDLDVLIIDNDCKLFCNGEHIFF